MDIFQVVYLLGCFALAKIDVREHMDKPIAISRIVREAILVAAIILWPVWLFPTIIYVAAGYRRHNR